MCVVCCGERVILGNINIVHEQCGSKTVKSSGVFIGVKT